ncbi:MAG: phosphoribosylformylglycinamidine synthase subunit PurL [Chitinophagaceae bacterium]|nr:phosphoribosylformylglycinamidine synthase subunit PurL [Chitinophagaceae bacterium]
MEISVETARKLRLTDEEFEHIKQKLGRTPNFNELCAFSGMWSEHCSYKNSIIWLKTLPREGKRTMVKAGEENAGLLDIGDGLAVVFKIESHNHPSAIEPFQGAATGVGGIHRDIFTMGARPVAALNSLRFGNLNEEKTQHLLAGVVHGIGHYGNCFGVPTVGGEIYFEPCYHTNPLVNAMSVGIVKKGKTVSAAAVGVGNPVIYVGSATGKDGIGGASFASADITEESAQELPAVQVGDPFQEKKLLEACLEVIQTGAVAGMQDMGAAGIICSTSEMSAKANTGMRIYLDKVPTRQQNMKAWELLLSESQERMLLVAHKGREQEVMDIFSKWDLPCAVIGEVTDDGMLEFLMNGKTEALIPAKELVLGGGAPQYNREYREPAYFQEIRKFNIESVPDLNHEQLKDAAWKLIQWPTIASKRWIYRQYDSMVGTNNVTTNAPADAAVIVIRETEETKKTLKKGLALTTDCNSRYVFADPYKGAMIAVAEAARNIVCTGGIPLGITNCLNFGNPYDPEVYYQFVYAVKGMGEACRKMDLPVTGGNVSFYNQNPDGPVFPTPTIGMVGLVEDVNEIMTLSFKKPGDVIFLLGKWVNDISSSQYLAHIAKVEFSPVPYFDLDDEMKLQHVVSDLIQKKLISSAHDVSEGGVIVTLFEKAFPGQLGFSVTAPGFIFSEKELQRKDAFWLGEAQGRILVSLPKEKTEPFVSCLQSHALPHFCLGHVTEGNIEVEGVSWGQVQTWKTVYDTAIENYMMKENAGSALTML